ncbi:MAG TPA: hypothetical protein VFL15_11125 [Gammaproteobacteria bacterium]|nr:hypothetical protein [Gammaproteobacteria bacterium]
MAHMNFDKAMTHFAAANSAARNEDQQALAELAAGLQRLSEALHHDVDRLLREIEALEKRTPQPP